MGNQIKINNPSVYFSKLIIITFAALQLLRLVRLPQFMDIYYHLQTAWGFIQAGGYSSWDFWEYAPLGRPHIYPPLFHIILALLMKSGASAILLAKFFEAATPVVFLMAIWNFIRKNYGEQLGFFTVVAFGSSFVFSVSLANHIPSSLALILGFLSFGEFFKQRLLRAAILLILCFYTHISVSWFFALTYIFYALIVKNSRKNSLKVVFYSLLAALPILIPEFLKLQFIHLVGNQIPGGFNLQIKAFNYILAGFGLFLAAKMDTKHKFFICLFLASFIFIPYPARFLLAEGYIAVILFCALALQFIWQRLKEKGGRFNEMLAGVLIAFILFVSPTLFLYKPAGSGRISYRVDWFDSTLSGLLLAKGDSIWFPWMYLPAVDIIKANSGSRDVVYSDINAAGMILSSLSERATANALFPETISSPQVDPFSVSSIIVLSRDLNAGFVNSISDKYRLAKVDETKYFTVFRNPVPIYRLKIIKAVVGFPVIITILFLLAGLFWAKELAGIFRKRFKK
jgi:hypothetical protein